MSSDFLFKRFLTTFIHLFGLILDENEKEILEVVYKPVHTDVY